MKATAAHLEPVVERIQAGAISCETPSSTTRSCRWDVGSATGAVTRIFVAFTSQTIEHFQRIIEATEELIDDLKVMAANNRTPNEFGLAVRQHPETALQITARNKQGNVREFYFSMKLDGQLKETAYLTKEADDRDHNLRAIERMIDALASSKLLPVDGSCLWQNILRKTIRTFLKDYRVYSIDPLGITTRMPIEFLKKYVSERGTLWDVALYSGRGRLFERG